MVNDPACIFCKIIAGAVPSRRVFEDDNILAFHDVAPWAPVHLLIVPKAHIATMYDTDESHTATLGRMMALAPRLAREQGAVNGFRMIVNTGHDGGQEVQHVHMHVIGGPKPWHKG